MTDEPETVPVTPATRAARISFIALSVITIAVMIAAIGPLAEHRDAGGELVSLLLLPILAVWAIGPYAVAHRFAHEARGRTAWALVGVQWLSAIPVLAIYIDHFFLTPGVDPQTGLLFAILPIYQFIAVVAVYYASRLWRRAQGTSEETDNGRS
jgi:hypothetical protein